MDDHVHVLKYYLDYVHDAFLVIPLILLTIPEKRFFLFLQQFWDHTVVQTGILFAVDDSVYSAYHSLNVCILSNTTTMSNL
jgi:hypothetical protein